MAQRVKGLVWSQQQIGLLLWHCFHPWPGNFPMPRACHPLPLKKEEIMFLAANSQASFLGVFSFSFFFFWGRTHGIWEFPG